MAHPQGSNADSRKNHPNTPSNGKSNTKPDSGGPAPERAFSLGDEGGTERRSEGKSRIAPRNDGVMDRRAMPDRRAMLAAAKKARGESVGNETETLLSDSLATFDRRRGAGRRLSDFTRSAEEGEMTTEQFLFLMAIDSFKKANAVHYPSWTDVLEVIRLLGYRKTMPMEISLPAAEDWREAAETPSSVRPDRWASRKAA